MVCLQREQVLVKLNSSADGKDCGVGLGANDTALVTLRLGKVKVTTVWDGCHCDRPSAIKTRCRTERDKRQSCQRRTTKSAKKQSSRARHKALQYLKPPDASRNYSSPAPHLFPRPPYPALQALSQGVDDALHSPPTLYTVPVTARTSRLPADRGGTPSSRCQGVSQKARATASHHARNSSMQSDRRPRRRSAQQTARCARRQIKAPASATEIEAPLIGRAAKSRCWQGKVVKKRAHLASITVGRSKGST